MRKFLIFLLAISLLLFAGCADNLLPDNTDSSGGTDQTTPSEDEENDENTEITKMFLIVNGNKLEVTLAKNSSVDALIELLKRDDIKFTATENGGFEVYGSIGQTLPTNNTRITAEVGDVLLYAGNNICIFFGGNSYSYTRIGKINGYSASELKNLLVTEKGEIQITISLK